MVWVSSIDDGRRVVESWGCRAGCRIGGRSCRLVQWAVLAVACGRGHGRAWQGRVLKWLDRTAIVAGILMEWQSTAKMPVWVWDECSSTSGRGVSLHPLSKQTQALALGLGS